MELGSSPPCVRNIISNITSANKIILCASAAETRFSVTAESKAMLYIPLQRNTM